MTRYSLFTRAALTAWLAAALGACGGGDDAPPSSPTPDATTSSPDADPGGDTDAAPSPDAAPPGGDVEVPTDSAVLFPFLQRGDYKGFPAESAAHPSEGPHGAVRTYINPALEASLAAQNAEHPVGAAAIKELYSSGGELRGWAVSVKVEPDSADGDGWYWYEVFSTTDGSNPVADGDGVPLCAGCHGDTGNDYVSIPFPLN